jgi:hypothetical protein
VAPRGGVPKSSCLPRSCRAPSTRSSKRCLTCPALAVICRCARCLQRVVVVTPEAKRAGCRRGVVSEAHRRYQRSRSAPAGFIEERCLYASETGKRYPHHLMEALVVRCGLSGALRGPLTRGPSARRQEAQESQNRCHGKPSSQAMISPAERDHPQGVSDGRGWEGGVEAASSERPKSTP